MFVDNWTFKLSYEKNITVFISYNHSLKIIQTIKCNCAVQKFELFNARGSEYSLPPKIKKKKRLPKEAHCYCEVLLLHIVDSNKFKQS